MKKYIMEQTMDRNELSKIAKEADEWHVKLEKLYNTYEKIKKLYRGITVWFSPIIENPEIMFLGINPGAGYYNNNNKTLVHRIEPPQINEYVDDSIYYILKRDWNYVFGNMKNCLNRKDLLINSVKSNFCYFATEKSSDMKKLFTQISANFKVSSYELCGNWTRRMINEINPKILICEGKESFDLLNRWSFPGEFKLDEKVHSITRGHIGTITVIQVSRVFSTLKDAGEIVKQIKRSL
jgi:hypothetical protein